MLFIIMLYFLIGFVSDIVLNYLSRQKWATPGIKALKFYFERKTIKNSLMRIIISAINAGLTIVVAALCTMVLTKFLLGFYHPTNLYELGRFIIMGFLIGYGADILIYKTQLFGESLNPYYHLSGAGLWGALSFIFSIIIVYFIMSTILSR